MWSGGGGGCSHVKMGTARLSLSYHRDYSCVGCTRSSAAAIQFKAQEQEQEWVCCWGAAVMRA